MLINGYSSVINGYLSGINGYLSGINGYLSPLALQFHEFFHIYQIYPLIRNGLTGVFQRTQCHLYSHHSGTKEIYHPSGPKKASLLPSGLRPSGLQWLFEVPWGGKYPLYPRDDYINNTLYPRDDYINNTFFVKILSFMKVSNIKRVF